MPATLAERAAPILTNSAAQLAAYPEPHLFAGQPVRDLDAVLAGAATARNSPEQVTVFCSVGLAGTEAAVAGRPTSGSARLTETLRYEPCCPACANWLRYGIQPKSLRPGLIPGLFEGKAHRPENVGYAGRRVLASRKCSGKTLADHCANRKAWLMACSTFRQPSRRSTAGSE